MRPRADLALVPYTSTARSIIRAPATPRICTLKTLFDGPEKYVINRRSLVAGQNRICAAKMDGAASIVAFVEAAQISIKSVFLVQSAFYIGPSDQQSRVARFFIQKIRAYRQANNRIAELVIRIEGIWIKTETQIVALDGFSHHDNERLRDFHEECLRRLIAKLSAASAEIETFAEGKLDDGSTLQVSIKQGPLQKIRYSLLENHLQKTIRNLEDWHAVFDPSWFLITLQKDEKVDSSLSKSRASQQTQQDIDAVISIRSLIQNSQKDNSHSESIFRGNDFVSPQQEQLRNSSLAFSTCQANGAQVIIDTTAYAEGFDKGQILTYVRDLARILSCSQPSTLGLLQCIGVLRKLDSQGIISQLQYIFSMPTEPFTAAASLRELLLSGPISLDAKFSIAKSLSRGVMAVHSASFVHKNIRPDNILAFSGKEGRDVSAYLVGFERSRPATGNTNLIGDMQWERNLYRHPRRQGIMPEDVYIMQHDIYSLGVCLLEVGIWISFILPTDPPTPSGKLHIDEQLLHTNTLQASWEIKHVLTGMAKKYLPNLMGLLYTEIVISCLTCLDSEDTNIFANEKDLYDEDGILVGVVFIEKILSRLTTLSI